MRKTTSEIMTRKLISVHADAELAEAYRLMLEKRIRHLPVRGDRGEIVGMLSDRDLQRAMKPTPMPEDELGSAGLDGDFDSELRVRDIMSWPVRGIRSTLPAREAAERMLSEKISALLVVDDEMHAVGIVTTDDLLQLLLKLLAREPSEPVLSLGSLMADLRKDLSYLS